MQPRPDPAAHPVLPLYSPYSMLSTASGVIEQNTTLCIGVLYVSLVLFLALPTLLLFCFSRSLSLSLSLSISLFAFLTSLLQVRAAIETVKRRIDELESGKDDDSVTPEDLEGSEGAVSYESKYADDEDRKATSPPGKRAPLTKANVDKLSGSAVARRAVEDDMQVCLPR